MSLESSSHNNVTKIDSPARSQPPEPLRAADGPWSLAFSGGGIRSATFCLGLARALAKKGLFQYFRIMSTVSGGGYVGSAIGRLYGPQAGAAEVQRSLADDNSLFLLWLRRNGRFLLPAGADDMLQFGAGYLRSLIATHWEVGVLATLLAVLTVLPHLLMGLYPVLHQLGSLVGAPWWSLLPFLLPPGAALYYAFWFTRSDTYRRKADAWWAWGAPLAVLACCVMAWGLGSSATPFLGWADQQLTEAPAWLLIAGLTGMLGMPMGLWLSRRSVKSTEHARISLTRWSAHAIAAAGILATVGLLDLLSWVAAREFDAGAGDYLAVGLGMTATLLLALRAALPAVQRHLPAGSHTVLPLHTLAHVLGLLLSLVLVFFWMTAVQWWVFFGPKLTILAQWPEITPNGWRFIRWSIVLVVVTAYCMLSGPNLDQLNRASLHPFYRSRLARAYVSVGNAGQGQRFTQPLTQPATAATVPFANKVSDAIEGDDPPMQTYGPDLYGGPLHLVNVCINQTRDDAAGTYNADRKGSNLAVSRHGFEFGTAMPTHGSLLSDSTLAQWAAISGAAVSAGMGSDTRSGVAALSFLSCLRLGYWWDWQHKGGKLLKYKATLSEWLGSFPGIPDSPLYLSDGGHYDNTGIYALLKRKPALIVAADCGADPNFVFADVENLIRKARIDYGARIEFLDPQRIINNRLPHPLPLSAFGTPDSIGPEPGTEHLLLARIIYDHSGKDPSVGALLLVKPRRVKTLSMDVAGYSDRDTAFPQQTTGDQFFDEAQWESYCELGLRLGTALDDRMLEAVMAAVLQPDAPVTEARSLETKKKPESEGSRRERIGLSTGQKIGIGAALSVAVAGWQVLQEAQKRAEESRRQEHAAIRALLEPKDEMSNSLVESALKQGAPEAGTAGTVAAGMRNQAFGRLVERLDDLGVAFYGQAQQEAIRAVAKAISHRCESALARRSETFKGVIPAAHCIEVLAQMTQQRRNAWTRSLSDYQRQVSARPAHEPHRGRQARSLSDNQRQVSAGETPDACDRGQLRSPPIMTLRNLDPSDAALVSQSLQKQGLQVGIHQDTLLQDYERRLRESGMGAPAKRQVRLLAQASDMDCAADLTSKLEIQQHVVDAKELPGFTYGQGEIQVVMVLAPDEGSTGASEPQVAVPPEATTPPETAEPPSNPPAADKPKPKRLIYVQFQGSFTRDQVNKMREELKEAARKAITPFTAEVPAAERIAGRYGNSVRYFNEEASADAQWLAGWVNQYFSATDGGKGCTLQPPAVPLKANASGAPKHLEIWINPACK